MNTNDIQFGQSTNTCRLQKMGDRTRLVIELETGIIDDERLLVVGDEALRAASKAEFLARCEDDEIIRAKALIIKSRKF